MKKILLTLILGIFLLSFTSAQIQSLGTFRLGDDINLIQTCDNCTFNNITSVLYPNSTQTIGEFQMTKTGTVYNFTLTSGNATAIGTYIVNGFGDLDGIDTVWNYIFDITQTGLTLETSDSILLVVILIATFVLFLGFLYPAITLPYSNKTNQDGSITRIAKAKYLKLLSIWFAYGFLMWFLQTLNLISTSFVKLTDLTNFITNIFTYSWGLSVGFTLFIIFLIFIESWKDIILSNSIKKFGKAFPDGRLQ